MPRRKQHPYLQRQQSEHTGLASFPVCCNRLVLFGESHFSMAVRSSSDPAENTQAKPFLWVSFPYEGFRVIQVNVSLI